MTHLPSISLTAAGHFRLYLYAAILHLIQQVAHQYETWDEMFVDFPFLADYNNEIVAFGMQGLTPEVAGQWWEKLLYEWEAGISAQLPLRTLREATGLSHAALIILLTVEVLEEDPRFGPLFEAMHGLAGQHRPVVGLLHSWWREDEHDVRTSIKRMRDLGLLEVINPESPRVEWALSVPEVIWDAMRGDWHDVDGLHLVAHTNLPALEELVVNDTVLSTLEGLPALINVGEVRTVIVRGPHHNGRRTLLRTMAHELGLSILECDDVTRHDAAQWQQMLTLASMLTALPVLIVDLLPGETLELPSRPIDVPVGIVLGKHGGISGAYAESSVTLTLTMPDLRERLWHWRSALGDQPIDDLRAIGERFRMSGGNIRRVARLASAYAVLANRPAITLADVQAASRALHRQVLDTLAIREKIPDSDWSGMALDAATMRELRTLESRCRHRDQLATAFNPALGAPVGVRAMFSGPSGSGKTLAARMLAAATHMDLYRIDLASVVNKYIGETEKSLNQIFAYAEELDVMLLIDEGDALLTRRTDVSNANDRYANLETNFLLQRLEAFEGIVIITTNAGERIDSAFQRRMDVIVDFRLPEAAERWSIWALHLPTDHAIDQHMLGEIAGRCTLSGGQIRNAVLHASLLALEMGRPIANEHVIAAVQREYRKAGQVSPLRVAAHAVKE